MIDYNKLKKRAYECALKRGKVTPQLTEWEELADITPEKPPTPLENQICAIFQALMEALNEEKSGRPLVWYAPESEKPEGVAVELADAVIALLTLEAGWFPNRRINMPVKKPKKRTYKQSLERLIVNGAFLNTYGYLGNMFVNTKEVILEIEEWMLAQNVDFESILLAKMDYNERRDD